MQAEMAAMKKGRGLSKSELATPPPKVAAPSPKTTPAPSAAKVGKPPTASKVSVEPSAERPAPTTEGARMNRLRRLCEVKPSGKCNVPLPIHERWKKASKEEREAMIDELEAANWSKDRNKDSVINHHITSISTRSTIYPPGIFFLAWAMMQ